MKTALYILIAALAVAVMTVIPGQLRVDAIGAPTDNVTSEGVLSGGQVYDEIKPSVASTLLGPSTQFAGSPPGVTADLFVSSRPDKYKITSADKWYLDVDINGPGWLYIYEYFPTGATSPGQWIAYKWEVAKGGIWRLGPFSPTENEAEGQHTYKIWFYSDGKWAPENSPTSHNVIQWTYTKSISTNPVSPVTTPATPSDASADGALIWSTVAIAGGLIVLIASIFVVLYIFRKRRIELKKAEDADAAAVKQLDREKQEPPLPVTAAITGRLQIISPAAVPDIKVSSNRMVGRGDVARALDLDDLALVSRRHFEITTEYGRFYIQDAGSANGTKLNGTGITGKARNVLKNEDVIELADVIQMKFLVK